ncbi:MAG: methyltransferase domain-containing protein [Gammaproteobacteria bacterium]|nr:methyltransferase domain-containing protein [Gammaproteobacteria bacterium]
MANTTQDKTSLFFEEVAGEDWLEGQSRLSDPLLRSTFGYAGVLSSAVETGIELNPSVGNFWRAHSSVCLSKTDVYASPAAWPFANGELDLVVLHHMLDFARDPHSVFRDSARIVKPGGHLMVIGFNPFSLQGARRFVNQWRGDAWHYDAIRVNRLRDWCSLLGFVECGLRYGRVIPWKAPTEKLAHLNFGLKRGLPWGSYYVMLAKKVNYSGIRRSAHKRGFELSLSGVTGKAAMRENNS